MRFRKGSIMAVYFLDHMEDGDAPEEFVVFGRIATVTRDYIKVRSWDYKQAGMPDDGNIKRWTILRKAIVKAKRLEIVA